MFRFIITFGGGKLTFQILEILHLEIESSFSILSRVNRSVPNTEVFFRNLFHREIVARSILATDGNNLKCATTPSCLASCHFRAIIVRDGRMLSLLVDFLREIIILDILISSKKVSVLRYLLDQDTRGGGCERKV